MQIIVTPAEEVVKEQDIKYSDIRKGDWVSYAGTTPNRNVVVQGKGSFLETREINDIKYFVFLGEDNKETVLEQAWNERGSVYREVKE